jgi:hypothetical protein
VAPHEQNLLPFSTPQPYALLSAESKATDSANNKEMLGVCHDIAWCRTMRTETYNQSPKPEHVRSSVRLCVGLITRLYIHSRLIFVSPALLAYSRFLAFSLCGQRVWDCRGCRWYWRFGVARPRKTTPSGRAGPCSGSRSKRSRTTTAPASAPSAPSSSSSSPRSEAEKQCMHAAMRNARQSPFPNRPLMECRLNPTVHAAVIVVLFF